ncbi:mannitol dehydrogenase family protein [Gordoniibacillus kamchatkensis]
MKDKIKVAIVGAGKTGRGFVARFAKQGNAELAFIDSSEELVKMINEDRGYTIHFFGGGRGPIRIDGVRAAMAGSDLAIDWMADADLIFTAVGESNLINLAVPLLEAMKRRSELHKRRPVYVVTCENGVNPGKALMDAWTAAGGNPEILIVAEAAIFCSSVEMPGTRLDIQSESYDELPYDSHVLPEAYRLPGMVPEPRFRELLQRKIYTYNCLSACIAYLGALKGYEMYADAAADPDICTVLEQVLEPLNRALSAKMNLPLRSQEDFARRALRKFQDPSIRDDISRNARDVPRKLGPKERLIAPAKIIEEAGGDCAALALAAAAALHYRGPDESDLHDLLNKYGVEEGLCKISGLATSDAFLLRVSRYYRALHERNRGEAISFEKLLDIVGD